MCHHLFSSSSWYMSWTPSASFVILCHLHAVASTYQLKLVHFPATWTTVAIGRAPLLFMNISTVVVIDTYFPSVCFFLYSYIILSSCLMEWKSLFSFVGYISVLWALWASTLTQASTCSLMISFVFVIAVCSLIIPVIILSFVPFLNCSFNPLFLFLYTCIHLPLFWSGSSIFSTAPCCLINLHYWNDSIVLLC